MFSPNPPLTDTQDVLPALSRRAADRVRALPGLTFKPNYDMYSGYLHAGTGSHLFYLFVCFSQKWTNMALTD